MEVITESASLTVSEAAGLTVKFYGVSTIQIH